METTFRVTDDATADWALRKIREELAERDRILKIAEEQKAEIEERIQQVNEKYDNKVSFLKSCLAEYIMTVPRKQTKTQETYQLFSGKLIYKKPSQTIEKNDEVLLGALRGTEYIKTKETVDWASYKKNLQIVDGAVVDSTTGEVVEGCSVKETAGSFDIKLADKKEEDDHE